MEIKGRIREFPFHRQVGIWGKVGRVESPLTVIMATQLYLDRPCVLPLYIASYMVPNILGFCSFIWREYPNVLSLFAIVSLKDCWQFEFLESCVFNLTHNPFTKAYDMITVTNITLMNDNYMIIFGGNYTYHQTCILWQQQRNNLTGLDIVLPSRFFPWDNVARYPANKRKCRWSAPVSQTILAHNSKLAIFYLLYK